MRVEQKLMVCVAAVAGGLHEFRASSPMMCVLNTAPSIVVVAPWGWSRRALDDDHLVRLVVPGLELGDAELADGVDHHGHRLGSHACRVSRSMGTRPDTTLHCAAIHSHVVTTTIGTGALYLERSVGGGHHVGKNHESDSTHVEARLDSA